MPVQPDMPRPAPGGVRFTLLVPGAKQVFLVGSFNGWTKGATPMKAMAGDLWSVIVPLKTGEYTFMYLVDGVQWVTPPQAEDFVTDGFGQTNGVVVIR
jgi:1,4-alpha-glucan branching enzyme